MSTRAGVWVLAIAAVILATAAVWIGGEIHYRNCLTEHTAQAVKNPALEAFGVKPPDGSNTCSRWPF